MDTPELELVAANDLIPVDNLAYLLQYDTVYGRYSKRVEARDGKLVIDGRELPVLSEKAPENLPWGDLDVAMVFECTGVFTKQQDLKRHLQAGGPARNPFRPRQVGGGPHRGPRRQPA